MPCTVVGCHLLCPGSCLARGAVLQLFVQTYHRLFSAFWHFYNQCLINSFLQVIWLECESKVTGYRAWGGLCEVWWEAINARSSRPHEGGFANKALQTVLLEVQVVMAEAANGSRW
jgi:hypothetical protein